MIILSDSVTYGEFVSIVDMCETDGHKRYGSWDNKFVIWGEWPDRKVKQTNTITPLYCGTKPYKKPEQKPGVIDALIKRAGNIYTPQGLWLIVGLIALTLSYIIKIRSTGN